MIILSAPAKVNLWLRLLGVRADGYQEIDTAFMALELTDQVEVRLGGSIQTCTTENLDPSIGDIVNGIPDGPKNLAWRAARLFFERSGNPAEGFQIHLRKAIPHGAGLGGGSSDAAAVLLALAELLPHAAKSLDIPALAAELGSDVPFFLLGKPSQGQGRGEKLTPIPPPWQGPLLLVKPPFGVPTAWAYQSHRALGIAPAGVAASQANLWQNDLEPVVFAKYLPLAILKRWLLEQPGVEAAMMCGSGSTILAALSDTACVSPLVSTLQSEFGASFWTCLTRTAAGT